MRQHFVAAVVDALLLLRELVDTAGGPEVCATNDVSSCTVGVVNVHSSVHLHFKLILAFLPGAEVVQVVTVAIRVREECCCHQHNGYHVRRGHLGERCHGCFPINFSAFRPSQNVPTRRAGGELASSSSSPRVVPTGVAAVRTSVHGASPSRSFSRLPVAGQLEAGNSRWGHGAAANEAVA